MPPIARLRSTLLHAAVDPGAGGRIVSLVALPSGREALWRSSRRPLRAHPPGTVFDDVYAGGWDELLPNEEPLRRDGRELPDHGELWTTPLAVLACEEASVTLGGTLPVSGLALRKRVALEGDELTVELHVFNTGSRSAALDLVVHPALRIATGAEVRVGGRTAAAAGAVAPLRALVPDPAFGRAAGDFDWPHATASDGEPVRADRVPPPGASAEWLVLPHVAAGRCALVHRAEDWAVTLAFDPAVLPALQLFADYGGWQQSRFLLLEPRTAPGRPVPLPPGGELRTSVRCRVGPARIADDIAPDEGAA